MGKADGPQENRQKLSWTYRNKKRQGKTRKPDSNDDRNVQVQNKKARVIVRNLSFKVTEDDVRNLFNSFGEIEQIDLLRKPDGKPVGCGFVQFKRIEDASRAIFKTNKQEFLGRPITVSWAIPKFKFVEQLNANSPVKFEEGLSPSTGKNFNKTLEDTGKNKEPDIIKLANKRSDLFQLKKLRKERIKPTPNDRNQHKLQKRQKRSRLIIRNLPFTTTEKDLANHFSQYGAIEEVKLLTKPDGKRVGCGFVQFHNVQSAAKAIHYSNLQPMMDRLIVVDWAVPKALFKQANKNTDEEKEHQNVSVLSNEWVGEVEPKVKELNETNASSNEDENDEGGEGGKTQEEKEDGDDHDGIEQPMKAEIKKHLRVISHDVNEGKTVFLKNVPFSVSNEELKQCSEQFGPVYYALVCMDSLTEHSKGTAFIKFRNLEDAEKCLSSGTEFQIQGQTLDPHRAIDKKDVLDSKFQKSNRTTDSRNLYLVREGVILAGTPAAADVSAADMTKRLQMEQWKSQMLKNLNMFVSRVRLVVHNLPETLDDVKLRAIFKKHAGEKAVIAEARVMRDLKNPDAHGVGKSKEFGFVAFTSHEDALRALRSINNNPNIFSKGKRPIVAFSIENRVMVNAKQRRVQKSRDNNPLWKGNPNEDLKGEIMDGPPEKRFRKLENKNISNEKCEGKGDEKMSSKTFEPVRGEGVLRFSGVTSKPGDPKMRSKFNLKTQAQLHAKVQKSERTERKMKRKLIEQKTIEKNSRKEIKPKQGTTKLSREETNLDRMVEDYRLKLSTISGSKSKWYNT